MDEKKTDIGSDKYKGQPVRFEDKGDHYELIFTDEFNVPTSGTLMDGGKAYTIITDKRNSSLASRRTISAEWRRKRALRMEDSATSRMWKS